MEQLKKQLCVISKETYGAYGIRDIQTNSMWSENPYPNYAVVPETMVEDILATGGFCDITLDAAGKKVISYQAKEKPNIPEPPQEQTESIWDEMDRAYREGVNSL